MRAIVTGHSKGLGAALAGELLARGARVLGVSRSAADPVAGLEQVAADLADPQAVAGLAAPGSVLWRFLAQADAGPLLLINNAGMVDPVGPLGTLAPEATARAVALNVTAPLLLSDAFAAATDGAADRRILHISSGAARKPYAGWSVYGATKAALDHHARAVAADACPGLRIASVAPGVVDTDMQAALRALPDGVFVHQQRFVGLKDRGELLLPAQSAARLVGHLLSPDFGSAVTADVRELE